MLLHTAVYKLFCGCAFPFLLALYPGVELLDRKYVHHFGKQPDRWSKWRLRGASLGPCAALPPPPPHQLVLVRVGGGLCCAFWTGMFVMTKDVE